MKLKAFIAFAAMLLITSVALAAGPDTANLSGISTTPTSTQNGQGKNYTVTNAVNAGDTINLNFMVGVSGSGATSTTYPDTLNLTATTLVMPGADNVNVAGLSSCLLSGRTATCNKSATITAPSSPGAYQVKILANDGRTGSGKMNSDSFFLNFTVAVPSCTAAPTTLVLGTPACTLYRAGSVTGGLTATLMSGTTPLVSKTVTFYVDGKSIGTADTDSNGVATLTSYDPSSLTVGDHTLSAAWQSDDKCYQNPAVTGSTLGIEYLFIGYQQPINADGSSIFTGKSAPVKIRIADANAAVVPDADALVFFEDGTPQIVGNDVENATTGLNFDYGNVMRYDASADQYVYNWDLSTVTNGAKTVRVFLDEGSCAAPRQVVLSVKRKK